MKTTIQHYFLAFGFWLLAFGLQAQDYEWIWAKNGGGINQYSGETQGSLAFFHNEMIWDIAIDEDNNYYFLASLSKGSPHVDGNPITDYSSPTSNGARSAVFFSFTCDGTYRWSHPVGGGGGARAYKLTLDNNGGIYLMFSVITSSTTSQIHFSEDDVLPLYTGTLQDEQEALRRIFLLKYDTDNGDLIWRKDIHGNVSSSNWFHCINHLQIDNNDILHTVVGFQQGVHIDGQLTVPVPEENEKFKYYLLKFDTDGNLMGTPLLLPMGGEALQQYMSFRYDETLNRYYIAGYKHYGSVDWGPEIFFNDVTFGEQNVSATGRYCFVISFNPNDFQDWWYREIVLTGGLNESEIHGMEIDSNSDIYVTGSYDVGSSNTASFGEHIFASTINIENPTGIPWVSSRPFLIKMNPQGEVQWSKTPNALGAGGTLYSLITSYDLTFNGDEVAIATVGTRAEWGNFSMTRPDNHGQDPVVVRFDKQTGEVLGLHDIMGYQGENNYMTAITADNDGNYVVGGAMRWGLFMDNPNGIATLQNSGSGHYTDFFFARLANSACGSASNEVFAPQTLRLYPNPTNGLVYIETSQDLQSYEVYNLLGQRLLSGNFNNNLPSFGGAGGGINMQDLSNGTYIVKVKMRSGEVMTSKVIKQ